MVRTKQPFRKRLDDALAFELVYAFATVLLFTRSSSASGRMAGSAVAACTCRTRAAQLPLVDQLQVTSLPDLKFSWNSMQLHRTYDGQQRRAKRGGTKCSNYRDCRRGPTLRA